MSQIKTFLFSLKYINSFSQWHILEIERRTPQTNQNAYCRIRQIQGLSMWTNDKIQTNSPLNLCLPQTNRKKCQGQYFFDVLDDLYMIMLKNNLWRTKICYWSIYLYQPGLNCQNSLMQEKLYQPMISN